MVLAMYSKITALGNHTFVNVGSHNKAQISPRWFVYLYISNILAIYIQTYTHTHTYIRISLPRI